MTKRATMLEACPIVMSSPRFHFLLGILQDRNLQGREPVLVQALLPTSPIESLDEGVVRGLTWPAEVQLHSVRVGSLIQTLRREFRSVVHLDAIEVSVHRGPDFRLDPGPGPG